MRALVEEEMNTFERRFYGKIGAAGRRDYLSPAGRGPQALITWYVLVITATELYFMYKILLDIVYN